MSGKYFLVLMSFVISCSGVYVPPPPDLDMESDVEGQDQVTTDKEEIFDTLQDYKQEEKHDIIAEMIEDTTLVCSNDGDCIKDNKEDQCMKVWCDKATGECKKTPKENNTPCTLSNKCEKDGHCIDGVCKGIPILCEDNNPCTSEGCDPETGCVFTNKPDGEKCDDGNNCTKNDQCKGGKCVGEGLNCDDGNPCTDDKCDDPAKGCYHINTSGPCDDKNPCTENDMCSEGKCVGSPIKCDDQNPCTDDSCDPDKGCIFKNKMDGFACDDGNNCTKNDQCKAGKCFGEGINCDDGNPCTDDSCDPLKGCIYTPNNKPCDDGNKCTTNDMCKNGECVGGSQLNCDDGNVCTDDLCYPDVGCKYTYNDSPCEDGNLCTEGDKCQEGKCMPGAKKVVCNDNNPCTTDSCDPQKGCVYSPLADGTKCDDKNPCTVNEACKQGKCLPTVFLDCQDTDPCTKDWCEDFVGCHNDPKQDGAECGETAQCFSGKCIKWEIKSSKANPTAKETRLYAIGKPYKSGAYFLFGGDNSEGSHIPKVYILNSDLTFKEVFAKKYGSGFFYGYAQNLTVGEKGYVAKYVPSTQSWTDSNTPLFYNTFLTATAYGNVYWMSGTSPVTGDILTNIFSCTEDTNSNFIDCHPMVAIKNLKDCNQMKISFRGVFALSSTQVFFVGSDPKVTVIGFYDGNLDHNCTNLSKYSGEVYYEQPDWDYDLIEPITVNGPGALNDIHGSSEQDIWAVGDLGTIYRFDGKKWQKINPAVDIKNFDKSHDLKSVWVDKKSGVHIIGIKHNPDPSVNPLYLHASMKPDATGYEFNAYILGPPSDVAGFGDVIVDKGTGDIYIVGWISEMYGKEIWGLVIRVDVP